MMRGSCLCGAVQFQVIGPYSKIGLCHCSLCRKASGAGFTAVIALAEESLQWLAGQHLVRQFERPSGYGLSFCGQCGSPVPDPDLRRTMYRVPVGLLDGDPPLAVGDHIFVASKAEWDHIADTAPQFDGDGPPRPRDQQP